MSYPNVWLHILNNVSDLIRKTDAERVSTNYSAAATGAHDVLFTRKYLRKYGIQTISDEEISEHMCSGGVEFHRSSNKLASQVLKSFGYEYYSDIDIYDRADIVCDLSRPVSTEYHEKYDLVLDITSTYVTNIIQSYSNTSKMTKTGGIKIVVTTIGDHTNRFDLNPSPNFLIDFHLRNGFQMERAFMINPKGTTLPYRRFVTKSTPIFILLPFGDFLITMFKALNTVRRNRPTIRRGDSFVYPARPGDKVVPLTSEESHIDAEPVENIAPPGIRKWVKEFLRTRLGERMFLNIIFINRQLRYLRNSFIYDNTGSDWYAYFVFRKVDDIKKVNIHITSHYKMLDQTK